MVVCFNKCLLAVRCPATQYQAEGVITMKINRTGYIAVLMALFALMLSSCGGGGGGGATSDTQAVAATDSVLADVQVDSPKLVSAPEADAAISAMKAGGSNADDVTEEQVDAEVDSVSVTVAATVPPLGASGGPDVNTYYVPSKAFDGEYNTWWAGEVKAGAWELVYGFQQVRTLTRLHLNFYSEDYLPRHIWILTSMDGLNWTKQARVQWNKYTADVTLNNVPCRYVRFYMRGNPKSGFPLVRDINWFPQVERKGSFAEPSVNENYYFPTNMFDNRTDTWWAGLPNAGAWQVYYFIKEPKLLGDMTMDFFNVNYRPQKMTLFITNDGETWEEVGAFSNYVWPPRLFVGRSALGIKLEMSGNPASTFPLVRDINFAFHAGAYAAPNENNVSWPAPNAFDGNPNTWWVGKQQAGSWNVFYGFTQPTAVGSVTLSMYSTNHRPQSVELFISNDGETWTSAGLFPPGAAPTLAVNATTSFLRISMQGNPAVGYPIIKDISW
jgi:hypothetical protein